jgi:hypothetical protein
VRNTLIIAEDKTDVGQRDGGIWRMTIDSIIIAVARIPKAVCSTKL